jgi:hypothetical protein
VASNRLRLSRDAGRSLRFVTRPLLFWCRVAARLLQASQMDKEGIPNICPMVCPGEVIAGCCFWAQSSACSLGIRWCGLLPNEALGRLSMRDRSVRRAMRFLVADAMDSAGQNAQRSHFHFILRCSAISCHLSTAGWTLRHLVTTMS